MNRKTAAHKETNVPQLRFEEFNDNWEQRKFSDLYVPLAERNSDLLPYNKTLSAATMTYKTDGNGAADSSLANYKRLRIGDIAFEGHTSKTFRYGRFVLNDTGDGIMSPRFSALRPLTQMPTNFWKYYIHYEPIMRKVLVASTKAGTMMNELVTDEFLKSYVLVPSIEEQTHIGGILKNIDHLITLHQHKYERLKTLKQAMLQKMFPREGKLVPEIRFEGFTEAWEQRKLSEIADKVTEKNAGLQYVETFTNSAEFGIISQRDFFDHDIAKLGSLDGYYIVKNEDFVYNPRISSSAPVGPINRNKLERTGVMSPLYTVFRPHDIDTTYFEYFFKCGYWHSFMTFNGDSGARADRFSIKDNMFFQMPIPIPHIDEQRKIGELLTRLDHLITLHQRKYEKLLECKKAFLTKMFPG